MVQTVKTVLNTAKAMTSTWVVVHLPTGVATTVASQAPPRRSVSFHRSGHLPTRHIHGLWCSLLTAYLESGHDVEVQPPKRGSLCSELWGTASSTLIEQGLQR